MPIEVSAQKVTISIARRTVAVSVFKGIAGDTGPEGPQGERGPQGPPSGSGTRIDLSGTVDLSVDDGSGNLYTNSTASAVANLPASADVGDSYYGARFRVTSNNAMRVQARGTDVIRYGGVETDPGGFLTCDARDAALDVEYIGGGVFLALDLMGQWVNE